MLTTPSALGLAAVLMLSACGQPKDDCSTNTPDLAERASQEVVLDVVDFEGRPFPRKIDLDGAFFYMPRLARPPADQPGALAYPIGGAGRYHGLATKSGGRVTLRIGNESFVLDGPIACF